VKTTIDADEKKKLVLIKLADSLKKKHLHRHYTLTDREKLENKAQKGSHNAVKGNRTHKNTTRNEKTATTPRHTAARTHTQS
jgi:hypothetical protein